MIKRKVQSGRFNSISFISCKNFNETRGMCNKSDNFETMMGVDTNVIIKNLVNSILQRFQKGLQESMRGGDFVFDYVESLNYIFHKVDLQRLGSYIETPDWIQNKSATINCQNHHDNKCFQYAISIALNYDEIKKHQQRVNKVKTFINKYDWSEINFPSHVGDWKKF